MTLAGLLRLDGAPADAAVPRACLAAMPRNDSDRAVAGAWSDGPVALAWQSPEPPGAPPAPPYTSRDGRLRLIGDVRLDNRAEIGRALGLPSHTADGTLCVEALAATDLAALSQFVGPFALVSWDAARRRLTLARDALGIRALYWARQGPYLWWASELQAMLTVPWYTPAICEGAVCEYLALLPVDLRETVFAGIVRVPQAHAVVADAAAVREVGYWQPPVAERNGLSDAQHAEVLGGVLTEAVRCRLGGGAGTVGFHLSGGLDSSSVTAIGRAMPGFDRGLHAYSLTFADLPRADERRFVSAMAGHLGIAPTPIDPRGTTRDEYLAHVTRHRDLPDGHNGEPLIAPTFRVARADGVRAIVTGIGGDNWLYGNLRGPAMHLRHGRLVSLARELRAKHAEQSWVNLLAATILPNVPRAWKRPFRPLADRVKRPAWIPPAFARRMNLGDRIRAYDTRGEAGTSPMMRESLARFWSGEHAWIKDRLARTTEWWGVELRHPFLDRRVVECVLTLPDDQRVRGGETRGVLRRAMGPRLHPDVLHRQDKADFIDLMPDAIAKMMPEGDVSSWAVVAAGWVDPGVLRPVLARVAARRPGEALFDNAAWGLLHVCGVEAWLRQEQAGRGVS